MKEKYKKFYMMFDKRFKDLILCSNTLCNYGIVQNSKLNSKHLNGETNVDI